MLSSHAVVLVSGGGAVTPYTTPTAAAGRGQAAGNTMTALRAFLLDRGHAVYTSPARISVGEVSEDTGWEGFGDVPEVLPASMTVNAVGRIDDAGAALDAFLEHIADVHGIESIDLIGHSMGGLFSRAALARRRGRPRAVPVRRLITLGTPWTGGILGDVIVGDLTLADAHGDRTAEVIMRESVQYAADNSEGAADEVSERYLAGPDGWNARQTGILDGIPVTLIAGSALRAAAEPTRLWPHDGLVARRSALAELVPAEVLPSSTRHEFDDVHSIFVADRLELPWERALTWDPEVHAVVERALANPVDPTAPAS